MQLSNTVITENLNLTVLRRSAILALVCATSLLSVYLSRSCTAAKQLDISLISSLLVHCSWQMCREVGICKFITFPLSVPVQLIAWEDLSPKWPTMCRVGR